MTLARAFAAIAAPYWDNRRWPTACLVLVGGPVMPIPRSEESTYAGSHVRLPSDDEVTAMTDRTRDLLVALARQRSTATVVLQFPRPHRFRAVEWLACVATAVVVACVVIGSWHFLSGRHAAAGTLADFESSGR